jgi:ComF family protein
MRHSTDLGVGKLVRGLLDLAMPSCCALCGRLSGATVVCKACHQAHLATDAARCPQCANLVDRQRQLCAQCMARRRGFDATLAAATYAEPVDSLVLQLKFSAQLALAPWMAAMLRDALLARPDFRLPNLLCPVPLAALRLQERGFNQALEIARPLSASLGIPLQPSLAIRARETVAQSLLEHGKRAQNIRNAFTLHPALLPQVRGLHIGIVDDVMSSGHTLGELAALFKRCGADRVSVFVFARTPLS